MDGIYELIGRVMVRLWWARYRRQAPLMQLDEAA